MNEEKSLLTPREREILVRIRYTNRQIACALGIRHQTVKNHLTNIYEKLCDEELQNRTSALVAALRADLVTVDDIL